MKLWGDGVNWEYKVNLHSQFTLQTDGPLLKESIEQKEGDEMLFWSYI